MEHPSGSIEHSACAWDRGLVRPTLWKEIPPPASPPLPLKVDQRPRSARQDQLYKAGSWYSVSEGTWIKIRSFPSEDQQVPRSAAMLGTIAKYARLPQALGLLTWGPVGCWAFLRLQPQLHRLWAEL